MTKRPDDNLETLRMVIEDGDQTTQDILDFMIGQGLGIYIGDEWYSWDQVKHLFRKE